MGGTGDDEGSGFSSSEHGIIYTIICVQGGIALMVDFFIVFTFLRFKELQKRSYELVFIISICSMCASAAYMMNPEPTANTTKCTIQGLLVGSYAFPRYDCEMMMMIHSHSFLLHFLFADKLLRFDDHSLYVRDRALPLQRRGTAKARTCKVHIFLYPTPEISLLLSLTRRSALASLVQSRSVQNISVIGTSLTLCVLPLGSNLYPRIKLTHPNTTLAALAHQPLAPTAMRGPGAGFLRTTRRERSLGSPPSTLSSGFASPRCNVLPPRQQS
jgi:hypothetical protein